MSDAANPDDEVLAANTAFYAAFAASDPEAMDALWARARPVACIHPGWDALRGRERVMASWRAILAGDSPQVRCSAATAHVLGDSAFVVCHEMVEGSLLVATNVFVREAGAWKLAHHQAAPLARQLTESRDDDADEGDDTPPPGGLLN